MLPFRHLVMPLVAAAAVALAATVAAPPALGASHERERLQETRERLEQVEAEIRDAEESLASGQSALTKAEQQLARVLDAVDEAQAAVDRQQMAVDEARERVQEYRRAAAARTEALRNRIVDMYKAGGNVPQLAMLGGEDPGELLRRAAVVRAITDADSRVIEEQRAAVVAEAAQQQQLKAEEAALSDVLAEQEALFAKVEEIRNSRAIRVAESRSDLAGLRSQEQVLEADSQQLAATITRVEREQAASRASTAARDTDSHAAAAAPSAATSAGAAAPAPSAGGWGWPVNGTVTSEYGYRWGRMHEGIDIAAPTGTPLLAARAGTVTFAGTMSGYGYVTLIDHGGGFVTAYAHQNRLIASAGERVSQGQQIGEVGSTGRSTGPHVHFEVRLGGAPRNPRGYLP